MKINEIKPGMHYKATRKEIISDFESPLIIGRPPSFCMSEYYIAEDLETKQKKYILVKDDIIVDVTDDFSKAVDFEKAEKALSFILSEIS